MRYVLCCTLAALIVLAAIHHRWRTCPICEVTYDNVAAVAKHVKNFHHS